MRLTPREVQVLQLVRNGLRNGQIATRLGVSDVPPSAPSIIVRAQGVDSRSAAPAGAAVRRS